MNDFECLTDCLIECVKVAGGSKRVGSLVWPEKTIDSAQRHLLNCLNEAKAERLTPDQVLLVASLARRAGSHAYMAYCAGHLHYEAPVPREPRDEAGELQRAFVLAVQQQQQILDRLQALAGQAMVGAVGAVQALKAVV